MHLVPSRWEKTGWKYTEVDPIDAQYFSNPNRINVIGYSPNSKNKNASILAEKRVS